jgi:SpoVT / AbrB like domain.
MYIQYITIKDSILGVENMAKKLTRHGNSLALIIDKPLLQMLNISEKTSLELLIEDGSLIIRPVQAKKKRSPGELKKIAQEIIEEYADVFQKLAK